MLAILYICIHIWPILIENKEIHNCGRYKNHVKFVTQNHLCHLHYELLQLSE